MGKKRFFDDRLKYLSFIQNTSEKRAISMELAPYIASMPKNRTFLRILDAGTGVIGDMPLAAVLTAPDGRPVLSQSESQFKTTKFGLYNNGGAQREVTSVQFSTFFNDGEGAFSIGYTHQNIDMICSMQSSTSHFSFISKIKSFGFWPFKAGCYVIDFCSKQWCICNCTINTCR